MNSIKKRIGAFILAFAMLTTALPLDFVGMSVVRAEGEEVDVTNSSDLSIDYSNYNLKITTTDNQVHDFTFDSATNTYVWPSGIGVAQAKEVSGQIQFNVADASTEVKAGTYFTFAFPEVLQMNEVTDAPMMIDFGAEKHQLGTYSVANNALTFHFTWDQLGQSGIHVSKMQAAFTAGINLDALSNSSDNRYPLFKMADGAQGYIEIPNIPTELSSITKEASVQPDNSVVWTINLGTDADTGVSLAGGKVVDILDGKQVWKEAYIGSDSTNKLSFEQDENNANRYCYTFDADSTLTAPATITVVTAPTTDVMSPASSDTSDVVLTNEAKYIAKNTDEEAALSDIATANLKKATVEKEGTIIDGNTIEWNIDLNKNLANVYRATVIDNLSKGLTVDENYGIIVTEVESGKNVTLRADAKSATLGGVNLSYTCETADGKQSLKVSYGSSFSKEYKITFRTNVSGADFSGDSEVTNKAYVDVQYPAGGDGQGAYIKYGTPEVNMEFKNGFIAIEGTNADAETGKLYWKVTPSTKSNDYAGSTMTLDLKGEDHGYVDGSFLFYNASDNTKVDPSKYSLSATDKEITITIDPSVDINTIYGTFESLASKSTYFADDKEHSYIANAGLEIHGASNSYKAVEKTAKQKLQNKMITKKVASSYAESQNEAVFTFTMDVNGNGINLHDAKLTDDLSKVLYVTDKSNLNSDNSLKTAAGATNLDGEDFKILSVTSEKLDDVAFSGKNVVVDYGNLTSSDQVKIVVGLTDAGKAKLKLSKDFSEKVLFAKNTATVTATELAEGGISASVEGLSRGQIAINKAMEKNGEQEVVNGSNTATLKWTLNINNMGADLGTNPYIVDTIPAGLALDKTTVKLYAANHGASGTLITGANTGKEVQSGDGFTYTSAKKKDGTTILTIYLPENGTYKNAAFVLKYDTAIAGDGSKYSNTAEMHVDDATCDASKEINVKAISYGVGTIRAFLKMTKTDELSGQVAVKGAKYGIFATREAAEGRKEEDTIDVGYTDDRGEITFTVPGGISVKKTYYVAELAAPENSDGNGGGYMLDENIYEMKDVSFGPHTIGPKGFDDKTAFVDERIKDTAKTGTVDLTNTFINDSEGGKHSTFTLYVYPTGTEKKAVKVTKTPDGAYKFVDYSEGTAFGGSDSVIDGANSVSNLKITDLPWGTYHLVETKTADGFILAKEIVFAVDSEGHVTGAKNVDNKMTVLTITDNVAADYTITGKFVGDTTTSTRTITGEELTQTGGKVYTGETIQGQTYTLVQTKTPDGYKKHANDSVKVVTGNDNKELTETPIKADVVIKDQEGNTVPNAKVSITAETGSHLNGTVVPDNRLNLDTKVNIDSNYTLKVTLDDSNKAQYLPVDQASATLKVNGDGSAVSTEPSDKSVLNSTAEGTTVTLVVQKIYANVEIREYSEEDTDRANLLTGGTFELYKKDGTKVGSIITDKNESGKTDITKLPAGAYYVKQVTAPNAYTVIDTETKYPVVITAAENGTTIYVDVFNHPVPGSITITKKSATGTKSLAGATYQLYTKDAEGNRSVVATATTDVDGKMKFEQLLWDNYYLREVSAPAGYQLDKQEYGPWIIDVSHQELVKEVSEEPTVVTIHTTGIDIRDGKDETDADVTKEDIGEGVLLTKMTYEVTGIFAGETEESTKEFTDDDKDGFIEVSNEFVLGNTYTFTQKSVKRPYNKVEGYNAEITEDNAKAGGDKIEIVNHMNRLAMELVDGDGKRLSGGKFELYRLDNDGNRDATPIKEDLESTIGKMELYGIEPGTYELVETVAPVEDGQFTYALDNSGLKLTLNEDNTVKVLSTNADAARQNEEAAAKNETKADAVLGKAGSVLKKDEAVLTYVNIPTRLYFDVDVFYNEDCNKDKDATADLAGVYYTVCTPENQENGFCIMRPISDEEDGKVVVEGLPLGTYEVKMSDSKGNNVILNKEVYTAEVVGVPFAGLKYANGATVEQEVKDVNGEKTGVSVLKYNVYKEDLVLAKTDAEDDSKLLAGSTYRLYRKDSFQSKDAINYDKDKVEDEGTKFDEFVAEATTDADGKLTFEGVTVGVEYLVREVGEPSGYQVSKDPIKVRFIRDGKLGTTALQSINDGDGTASIADDGTVTWKEPRLKVAIRLVDEEGNYLSGGTFDLQDDATGKNQRSWTSSDKNELFSGELTGGQSYTIVQKTTPAGYQPSENVTFVAERKALSAKDDYVQVITVVNTKKANAPIKKDTKAEETAAEETTTKDNAAKDTTVTKETSGTSATSAGTTTSATSDNHKAKVSSAWVHKSPKTNDSWFGDLVEWILTE